MKKIISVLLLVAIVLSFSACTLVRKIEKAETPSDSDKTENTTSKEDDGKKEYTVSDALNLVKQNIAEGTALSEETDIVADSDGMEYYIFASTEGDNTYYVSKEGEFLTALREDNATVKTCAETYMSKHGETDAETGFAYKVEYAGVVKNNNIYCYNFVVSLDNPAGATYKTNYLVSLDGKSSGEQVLPQ